jgi:RNA polymerase sigma-70 factor (ECF subfamily)
MTNPFDTVQLLERVRIGDKSAVGLLLSRHRELLRQYIELRLDPALRQRVDPSDIVQEAQIEIARRIHDYLVRDPMPFHVWIRRTAYQNLLRLRRQHLRAVRRNRNREVALPASVSLIIAGAAVQRGSQPLDDLLRQELAVRVQAALGGLSEVDREILLLRAYEGLDNQCAAALLDLDPRACSKRYARALLKLRRELIESAGESERRERSDS